MLVLEKVEFVEEVKAELAGYEEIDQEHIELWIKRFEKYLKQKNLQDKRIKFTGDKISIRLDDESDLFKIVDKYYAAIENEDLEKYWNNWAL